VSVIAIATEYARQFHGLDNAIASDTDSELSGLELRGVWIDPVDRSILFDVYDPDERFRPASDDPMHGDVFSVDIQLTADGQLSVLGDSSG
jgi:hypothetical protein